MVLEKVLTVVIPAYNISSYINKIMSSLLACDRKEKLEILIVNDGSKDDTKEKAIEYKNQYPEIIQVIDKKNGGHGSTINAGIEIASGKFFKVIDGDDWVDTKELNSLLLKLDLIEDDMVVCGFTFVDEEENIIKEEKTVPPGFEYEISYRSEVVYEKQKFPFPFHSLFYKTEIYKKSPKLDENCFYVDLEYALFPIEFVNTICFCQENVYMYRIGSSGQSVSPDNYLKNCNDLVTVLFSLSRVAVSYNICLAKRNYVIRRIAGVYATILDIYFYIDNKREANKFLIDIEYKLEKMYPEVFSFLSENNEIKILRLLNYNGYKILQLRRKWVTKRELK